MGNNVCEHIDLGGAPTKSRRSDGWGINGNIGLVKFIEVWNHVDTWEEVKGKREMQGKSIAKVVKCTNN